MKYLRQYITTNAPDAENICKQAVASVERYCPVIGSDITVLLGPTISPATPNAISLHEDQVRYKCDKG